MHVGRVKFPVSSTGLHGAGSLRSLLDGQVAPKDYAAEGTEAVEKESC